MRALVFFPHNIWPPQTGAHRRCIQMLEGLKANGASVIYASSAMHSDSSWASSYSTQDVDFIEVFRQSLAMKAFHKIEVLKDDVAGRDRGPWINRVPWHMKKWFGELCERYAPSVIIVNYADFAALLPDNISKHITTVIDSHDLLSVNASMREKAIKVLSQCAADAEHKPLDNLSTWSLCQFEVADWEIKAYEHFNESVFISRTDLQRAQARCRITRPHLFPYVVKPISPVRREQGPALFLAGNNPFNSLGVEVLARQVLPSVFQAVPDFCLNVAGHIHHSCSRMDPRVKWIGAKANLRPVYAAARFSVNPTFAGTGQQIKITEALACGLPVVAFKTAAEAAGIVHEVNGLVAGSPSEMADHVCRLWSDKHLCRRLSENAADFAREQHTKFNSRALWKALTT